ncbi:MAG: glycosyltransferase [Acidobacteriia bacterium]|nr:glycosyltransferase [Terriglobia bacterium]
MPPYGDQRILILAPTYEDWGPLSSLLRDLDREFKTHALNASVLIVDDGSPSPVAPELLEQRFSAVTRVDLLRLCRNVGHQRAIAIGLVYVHQNLPCDVVIVMDSDGEDRPADVPKLLFEVKKNRDEAIVFAARTKRLERAPFRFFYKVYRVLHYLLTGLGVRVGNFSAIPSSRLPALVTVPELWSHYAAAVVRARIPHRTTPLARGMRISGESRMNFTALVVHGLTAISVFGDIVGVRALAVLGVLMILSASLIVASVVLRLTTSLAIPGWATYSTGILGIVLLQSLMFSVLIMFNILGERSKASFMPLRDCPLLIETVTNVYQRP